jgi:NADPH-dependent 2,4-dienoyl-CoA reductase/sulfur reductase-like enzyme
MKYVILGNVLPGSASEAIRLLDGEGPIVMVGDDSFPPYSRPMISYVDGSKPHEKLPIRPPNFYESMKIKPILGQRAVGIDVENRRVQLTDATGIGYDRLLIATGADPRPLRAAG